MRRLARAYARGPRPDGGRGTATRDAEYAEHLTAAFKGLVAIWRGHAHIECELPARPLAWVWPDGEALLVEVATPGGEAGRDDYALARFARSPEGAADAARTLSGVLERDFGCSGAQPLFISLTEAGSAVRLHMRTTVN